MHPSPHDYATRHRKGISGGGPGSGWSTCGACLWNQLLDRLIQSPLEVDLADPERGIIVARYSGDPEPYVTCGWILVDRGGELEQVLPAARRASSAWCRAAGWR